jgi:glycine cleavage system H protein
MSEIPEDLRYTKAHEWIRIGEDGTATVGITDHAQLSLGDLVFVEVPEVERELRAGEGCAVVESVKAASDVFSPFSGTVIEVNEALADEPQLVNQDPYGKGWIFRLQVADPQELDGLLDAQAYLDLSEAEEQ